MLARVLPVLSLAVLLVGCPGDEPTPITEVPTDEPTPVEDPAIVGVWVSEGTDVSPLLALFNTVAVDATFNADGSYTVVSTDAADTMVTFTGTYTVDDSTMPHTIALEQGSPSAASVSGIWEVDAGVLTYEVIQTTPDLGFAPPTVALGFGSSSGPNLAADANIQIFRTAAQ
jgi:hypothetical protein